MKKPTLNKILLITAISTALLWIAAFAVCGQTQAELNKMMGIEDRTPEAVGAPYTAVESIFNGPMYFESKDRAMVTFNDVQTEVPNPDFLLMNRVIYLKGLKKSNPKSQLHVLGLIKSEEIEGYRVNVYQCKDNADALVAFSVLFNDDTTDVAMEIAYRNTSYHYQSIRAEIPAEPYFILDNLEDESIHDKFGADYTNEEVYEFLAQFGTPDVIINLMLRDLFYNQDFGVNNKPQNWQKQNTYEPVIRMRPVPHKN